ncbi:conserved hypothetical protein [Candidatus Sulfopaludibacter sp. SbA3]|nr:conserved hypothetical protein [Candidatus Sulfopaludibacter sp. SbA3]
MSEIDDLLMAGLKALPAKPGDDAKQSEKKRYSEEMSEGVAAAFAQGLRNRNLRETMPAAALVPAKAGGKALQKRGSERRMSGGLGAKNVDVTFSTGESGLILSISVKTINFADQKTGNYQKNLTNRRGDTLFESTTLHRRFPYAVMAGFMFLDRRAAADQTAKRKSTFANTHTRLRTFTGRDDPAGRPEQYERLYVVLVEASVSTPWFEAYRIGDPKTPISLEDAFGELLEIVAERNPDFYEVVDGKLEKAT